MHEWIKFPVFVHDHNEEFAERGAERCYPIVEKN